MAKNGIPAAAKQLFALGDRTEAAVKSLFREHQGSLFAREEMGATASLPKDDFGLLAAALLRPPWSDEEAERLITAIANHKLEGRRLDISLVSRWVRAHPNDAGSVIECMSVEPPKEIEILRVLSKAGSQKIVFLASWRLTQREVVLKRFLRTDGAAERELQSFPINLSHPNIIETHRLQNSAGELFLVEKRLAEPLDDEWRAAGIQEAANFLYDMASAIKFLHEHDRVHGDVKPDNIGKEGGEFILLDFGICRPIKEFSREATATGSLRTRAPELLLLDQYLDPPQVDVWALGATLFLAFSGRFPLIAAGEPVPRISHPPERAAFEAKLRTRVESEWDKWIVMASIPEPLRPVLAEMLQRDPSKRIRSSALVGELERQLPAFLRTPSEGSPTSARFSPIDEMSQLQAFLRATPDLTILPPHKRQEIASILRRLLTIPGFSDKDREVVQSMAKHLS